MLVFDTETTAFIAPEAAPISQQPRIVEFAAINLNPYTLDEVARYEFLVNPRIPIPPDSTKVHGITDEMVRDQPPFVARYNELCDIFGGQKSSVVHNSSFDYRVMFYELFRIGKQTAFPYPPLQFCTVEQSIRLGLGKTEKGDRLKLGQMYELLTGKQHKEAHRAMPDVVVLVECVREMRRKYGAFNKWPKK